MSDNKSQLAILSKLREQVPAHQVSQFPATAGSKAGLSYVNHAVVTDRLLEADPLWSWDFHTADGLPAFDEFGGMFIKLTVGGVTRIGYGDKGNAKGADAIKNAISDAIKNAAMRFGVALELWSKEELHAIKQPGQANTGLTELDLALIDALADHRRDTIGFDGVKFANWVQQTFKCASYDKMNRQALPDVIQALITPTKGTDWPDGSDPRKDDILTVDALKTLFTNIIKGNKS